MDAALHVFFDELKLWFEPTVRCPHSERTVRFNGGLLMRQDTPHRYEVVSTNPVVFVSLQVPHFIDFQSSHESLALPNRTYLHIHASCCRVANIAGAAGYYDLLADDG